MKKNSLNWMREKKLNRQGKQNALTIVKTVKYIELSR